MKRANTIALPRRTDESLQQRIEDLEEAVDLQAIEAEPAKRICLPNEFVGRLLAGEVRA